MQELGRETPGAMLRALMTERHAAFAQEMWKLFETTVARLEEEVRVLRAHNERQRCVLEAAQKRRGARRDKAKRTNPKKDNTKPVLDVEILTENSSDSENEWKLNKQPKEEEEEEEEEKKKEEEPVVSLDVPSEPEGLTENSSDSEDERGSREKPQNAAVQPDPERVGVVVLSDPQTENSSDSESERVEKPATSGVRSSNGSSTQKTGKKKSFECSLCQKPFNYKSVLRMHELSHGGGRPYECSQCGFSFMMKYRLDRHMEIHKRNRPSGCDEEPTEGQCSSSHVAETENSAVPGSSDGKNSTVPGSSDGENLMVPGSSDDTLKNSTVPGSSDEENWTVPVPSDDEDTVEFENTEAEEMDDKEQAHQSNRPQCLQCGKTFSTTSNMGKHIRTIHSKKKPSLKRKLQIQMQWRHQHLQCSECDRRFRFQTELTRHMKRAHSVKEKTTMKTMKTMKTKTKATTMKTMKTKTMKTKTMKTKARTTMKTKAVDKPFQCEVCQKRFRDRAYLQEHIGMHTGEKPHRCLICGKYFTFRKSHNAHMKLHESSR